ncbi:MAG: NADH-quinone oxidoreductase subunit L [Gemmatimonadota bacterium]|nr:NADH-quinone oxidoreductase subunit L [Gemmatimonadota bacterium]
MKPSTATSALWRTATAVVVLVGILVLAIRASAGELGRVSAIWGPRFQPVAAVDGVTRVMLVLVPVIAIPVVAYAGSSMRSHPALTRLLSLFVVFVIAMEILVVAADFLTLLIGWEIVGACSWALIGFEWRERVRIRAALDAYLTTRLGDLGLYLAAAVLFAATGSLRYDALASLHGMPLAIVAGAVLFAAAAKSAQAPFSPWLFSAMQGPTPASALLHSATMVAAGAYLLIRLSPHFDAVAWYGAAVAILGAVTAVAGGLVALAQRDLKKALAGSTSAQYGLMFVAIGAMAPGAGAMHLVTHAAFKALLFLGAGVVLHAAGTLDLGRISRHRLGARLPQVAGLFGVGALALAAVPPLGSAVSKEGIVAAAAAAPRAAGMLTVSVLLAGLLSAAYATRLQLLTFGGPATRHSQPDSGTARSPERAEMASLAVLALLTVALGVLWSPSVARRAESLTGSVPPGALWETIASLATVGLGISAGWLLWRRDRLLSLGLPRAAQRFVAGWFRLPALATGIVVRPVVALSSALAMFDARVVDEGIRGAVQMARSLTALMAWWGERGIGGAVTGLARAATWGATASQSADARLIDASVEAFAHGVSRAGSASRRIQSGRAHDYYTLIAEGTVALVMIAALAVWLC